MSFQSVALFCSENKIKFLLNAPMSRYTSFKIGGPADIIVFPDSAEQVSLTVAVCSREGIHYTVIGNGSNVLVSDSGIRGVVILLSSEMSRCSVNQDGTVSCLAGASLSAVSLLAMKNSLSGLEFAYGIPGSVGGALFMNAGAYGGEIKDVVLKADHINERGEKITLEKNEMALGYRRSIYSEINACIVSVDFKLTPGDPKTIKALMDDYMDRRRSKQPLEYPSAGSVFKRPEGHFAGALIEAAGLKGVSVGGAEVSRKHAGFIINRGDATCEDVERLIDLIKKKVFETSGVTLECEIKKI